MTDEEYIHNIVKDIPLLKIVLDHQWKLSRSYVVMSKEVFARILVEAHQIGMIDAADSLISEEIAQ